jgi:hypothetical protein
MMFLFWMPNFIWEACTNTNQVPPDITVLQDIWVHTSQQENKWASCRLFMLMKKDVQPTDSVVDRYVAFFTSMSVLKAILVFDSLPQEYSKR